MNWVYLTGSLGGIALMVGLAVLLFGVGRGKIANAAEAVHRLKDEVAGFRAGGIALDAGERAALVENARDGVVHLVVARGDGLVVRALKNGILKRAARNGTTLALWLSDFTLPRATLTLPDENAAAAWEARLARRT